MALKHSFKSLKPDPADATVIGATKWNADHYYVDTAGAPAATYGSVLFAGTAGIVTHLTSAAGVLTCPAADSAPAWSTTPSVSRIFVGDGTVSAPSITTSTTPTKGWWFPDAAKIELTFGAATSLFQFNSSAQIVVHQNGSLQFGSTAMSSPDVSVQRAGAGVLGVTSAVALGTNPATVGTVRVPNAGSVYTRNAANTADAALIASTSAGTFISGELYSVADSGILSLGATTQGFIFVLNQGNLDGAIFFLFGTANAVVEVSDPNSTHTVTKGTASSVNVYWSAGNGRYELENKRGATRNFVITRIGV